MASLSSSAGWDGGALQLWTGFSHTRIHTAGGAYTIWLYCNTSIVVYLFGQLWFFLWLVLLIATLFFFLLVFLKSGVSYMKQ